MTTLGYFESSPEMVEMVARSVDSGRLSYGPLSKEFEKRFANMHGCAYGIFTNSGTSSLLASLQALKEMHGWKDGAEVIVPSLTFVATVNVVYHCKLTPVLVDVDDMTYNIDPLLIESAITPETVAIIPVHLFGLPCDADVIKNIADNYDLRIVEDSCECILSEFSGKPVGSWGDVGCFSTYVAHHLVTGVGGLCTTNNPDLNLYIRSIVNHGIDTRELPDGNNYDSSWLGRKFNFTSIGHSFRATELEAVIGLYQLDDLHHSIVKRRENAAYLSEKLTPMLAHYQLPVLSNEHSFMVYPIVLREGNASNIRSHLANMGVESRSMVPLTNQPCYDFNPDNYPVSKWINQSGFYVGCHQGLVDRDLDKIANSIMEYFL